MPPRRKQAELQIPKKDKGKAREVIDVDAEPIARAASVASDSDRTDNISDWDESISKELTFNRE
jgi:hypothetical protein